MVYPEIRDSSPDLEKCRQFFDVQYSKSGSYWGDQPNLLVPLVSSYLRPQSRILIVGCGEGRDAVFLARLGFEVVATEISPKGLMRAEEISSYNGHKPELLLLDAHKPHDHLGAFDAVLLMNVIQFLNPDSISERIEHFKSLVNSRGIFSAQLFTIEDPRYLALINSGDEIIGRLTVEDPERKYRVRYFEKGELASYFHSWEMIYYHEGLMWDKPHGAQLDFHQHGIAQMIARKRS